MAKTGKAPHGFYSATEAVNLLGVAKSTFYEMVEKGIVKKLVPPGRSDGYYLKTAVDDLVRARELFTLQYAADPPTFTQATEEDIQGIYAVCISLWGTKGANPYELRLARYRKNPEIFYTLKYLETVVGFATLMPVTKKAATEILKAGKPSYEAITLDDILPFERGKVEYMFAEIAVRDGVPKPKYYGMRLLCGASRMLDAFAERGCEIQYLFATSRTADGIDLSRKLGFAETLVPNGEGLRAFVLNLETARHPLLREYQRILWEQKEKPPV